MARNRKHRSEFRFGPALVAFALCLLLGTAGVGYVWQKDLIHDLGRDIRQLEKDIETMRQANKQAADQLAYLRSPRVLEARVRELNLGLVQPDPGQILRLIEMPHTTPAVLGEGRTAWLNDE
jgi:type VI protein secretion system component VasK